MLLCPPILLNQFWSFIANRIMEVYSYLLGYGKTLWIIPFLFSLVEVVQMIRQKKSGHLLLFYGPVICHLALSSFKEYPFAARFVLYLAPLFIVVFAMSLVHAMEFVYNKFFKIPRIAALTPAVILTYVVFINFPIEKEEIKKSISYMDSKIINGQIIYVYYASKNPFNFYKQTGFVKNSNRVITGLKHRNENEKYAAELAALKGEVWFLFSHVYPWTEDNEEKYMVNFLLNRGATLLEKQVYKDSSVYLISI